MRSTGWSPAWNLECPWCDWYIVVNARGGHGKDHGSGFEAAELMRGHAADGHGRTWVEFLSEGKRKEQERDAGAEG